MPAIDTVTTQPVGPVTPTLSPITRAKGDALTNSAYATIDAKEAQRRATRDFTQYDMPQLQSSIAAQGQWYSTARQSSEKRAGDSFLEGSYDIQSAMNRQLDDITRQRMYAAMGVIL